MKHAKLFVISILVLTLAHCKQDTNSKFEQYYLEKVRADSLSNIHYMGYLAIEQYLLQHEYLTDITQNSYKELMQRAMNRDVVLMLDTTFYRQVPQANDVFIGGNFFGLGSLSLLSNEFVREHLGSERPAEKMAVLLDTLWSRGNLGDEHLNEQIIYSVSEHDFAKPMYRIPILSILFEIFENDYWRYYVWVTLPELKFIPKEPALTAESAASLIIDSIFIDVDTSMYRSFSILALGIDDAGDSVDVQLSLDRTNWLAEFLIYEKGVNPELIKLQPMRTQPQLVSRYIYEQQTLFELRESQVYYKPRFNIR